MLGCDAVFPTFATNLRGNVCKTKFSHVHFPTFGRRAHVMCFPRVVIGAYDCLHMSLLARQKIAPLFQPVRGKSMRFPALDVSHMYFL